jgi:hypothetical protein
MRARKCPVWAGLLVLSLMLPGQVARSETTKTYKLRKQETGFFVPKLTRGDTEFGGHGPKVKLSVKLQVSPDGKKLLAVMKMKAKETTGDRTTAEGTTTKVLYRTSGSQKIVGIQTPTISGARYVDIDHQEDYLVPGTPQHSAKFGGKTWEFDPTPEHELQGNDGEKEAVRMFVVVGDTGGGGEAGTKTGFRAIFNTIKLTVTGKPEKNRVKILKNVEDGGGDKLQKNGCAANAGFRVLNYYDHKVTQKKLYKFIQKSGNILSDNALGVPPGTLRDRLRHWQSSFVEQQYEAREQAREAMFCLIDADTPVILLTGWGSRTVRDFYAPRDDVVGGNPPGDMLHYVVLHGYDKHRKLFHIIDNGTAKKWSYNYFENVLFWEADTSTTALTFGLFAQVHNRTVLYSSDGQCSVAISDFTVEAGGYCSHKNHCISGVCTSNKCESYNRNSGQSCHSERQCKSKRCSSDKCVPKDFTGKTNEYCSHKNHCKSGVCTSNKCESYNRALAQSCKSDRQCKSRRCSSNRCIPKDGTGKTGEYCSHPNHCISKKCNSNKCTN